MVLALGVLVVIVVIVLIAVRAGSSGGSPTGTPTPSSTPAATTPSSTASPTAASTPAPTSAANANGAACLSGNVTVQALTDASSYAAGVSPKLSVAITNTGTNSCTIDAGTAKQVFTISSGSEVYWKSTDCQTDKVDAEVLIAPGKTVSSQTPIVWDRTRSNSANCSATRTPVAAGGASYHLETSVDGIVSAQTKQFILR